MGVSEGRIPWTAVNEYAYRYKLSDQEFDELWEIVSKLDVVYTNFRAGQAKIDKSRIGAKQPPKRGR